MNEAHIGHLAKKKIRLLSNWKAHYRASPEFFTVVWLWNLFSWDVIIRYLVNCSGDFECKYCFSLKECTGPGGGAFSLEHNTLEKEPTLLSVQARACHWRQFWNSWIPAKPPHPISLRFIVIYIYIFLPPVQIFSKWNSVPNISFVCILQ